MAEPPFDAPTLLGTLQRHQVRFVLIGAVAAIAQGSPLPTRDVDVTPERSPENLERLAEALRELDARLRLPDGTGLEFPIDVRMLSGAESWTLTTDAGDLDVIFVPAGTQGYEDLARGALELDLGTGTPVSVAALRDVIRTKETSNREKDRAQLPALRRTLELSRERQARGEPR